LVLPTDLKAISHIYLRKSMVLVWDQNIHVLAL